MREILNTFTWAYSETAWRKHGVDYLRKVRSFINLLYDVEFGSDPTYDDLTLSCQWDGGWIGFSVERRNLDTYNGRPLKGAQSYGVLVQFKNRQSEFIGSKDRLKEILDNMGAPKLEQEDEMEKA